MVMTLFDKAQSTVAARAHAAVQIDKHSRMTESAASTIAAHLIVRDLSDRNSLNVLLSRLGLQKKE